MFIEESDIRGRYDWNGLLRHDTIPQSNKFNVIRGQNDVVESLDHVRMLGQEEQSVSINHQGDSLFASHLDDMINSI